MARKKFKAEEILVMLREAEVQMAKGLDTTEVCRNISDRITDLEFVSKKVRHWLKVSGVQTFHIELGSSWENGYIESFNGKLRDELLNLEIFDTLFEAKVLVKR